nr:G protein-coupled receptor [Proales similis]
MANAFKYVATFCLLLVVWLRRVQIVNAQVRKAIAQSQEEEQCKVIKTFATNVVKFTVDGDQIEKCHLNQTLARSEQVDVHLVARRSMLVLDSSIDPFNLLVQFHYCQQLNVFHFHALDLNRLSRIPHSVVKFQYSRIQTFYQQRPISVNECRELSESGRLNVSKLVVKQMVFDHSNRYSTEFCPLYLKNAVISNLLTMTGLIHSLVKRNCLQFVELPETAELNVTVQTVNLHVYRAKINKHLVLSAFKNTMSRLLLFGQLSIIEPHVFENANQLRELTLKDANLRQLFHQKLDWLRAINQQVNLSPNQVLNMHEDQIEANAFWLFIANMLPYGEYALQANDKSLLRNDYTFPDEDICLFADFPLNRLLIPFVTLQKPKCSCTLHYLYSNHHLVSNTSLYKNKLFSLRLGTLLSGTDKPVFCDSSPPLDCNVNEILRNCAALSGSSVNMSYMSYEDLRDHFKLIDFMILLVLQPIVCVVSILFNGLIMITLRSRHNRKQFKEKMFKYMYLNSFFNLILSSLYMLQFVNTCIRYEGIYCSPLRTTLLAQYFKIVGLNYLGNVAKFCSNLSLIFFSTNRYVLVSDDRRRLFQLIRRVSVKKMLIFFLVVSCVLSSSKLFQFVYEPMDIYYDLIYTNNLPSLNTFVLDYKFVRFQKVPVYNISLIIYFVLFDFFNYIFNDLLCLLVNLAIDVQLIKTMRAHVRSKKNMISHEHELHPHNAHMTLKALEAEKKENDATKMVINSTLLLFLFRMPDLTVSFMFLVVTYIRRLIGQNLEMLSVRDEITASILNLTQFLYLVTLTFNFVFYYMYNFRFRESLHRLAFGTRL